MTAYTPFQRHLLFFAEPITIHNITIRSALNASLRLGLNFPVSLALTLAIRVLYAPFPHYLRPLAISSVTPDISRSQLEPAQLSHSKYTLSDLLALSHADPKSQPRGTIHRMIDRGHVASLWSLAADVKTGLIDVEDVRRFQKGVWLEEVVKRRRSRVDGKGDVLPFWRGGLLLVGPHSWAVGRLFGVRVYEP